MTNIRVNANSLPLSNPPATVQALISVTSATSIPVNNPTQILGFCEKGQTFWMSDFTPNTFTINLEENFSTAFKKKIEVNVSGDPISQNNPGFLYFTESGFTTNFSPADLTGKADTGTRLVARYKNLPSGTFLTVPTLVSSNTSPFLLARLLSNVNPDFSGGETASTGLLPVCQNSSMAVWEIVGPSGITGSSVIDRFAIPVTVSGPWGAMEVFGSYGPINITDIMSLDAPEPRFYDAAAGLFPYHNCPNTYLPVIMK